MTVNAAALLTAPSTVTVTVPAPGVRPVGTAAVMLVLLHALMLAVAVLPAVKCTVLLPWLAPKFVPEMTTLQFAGPDVGLSEEICGGTGFGTLVVESVDPSMSSSTFTLCVETVVIEYPTHNCSRSVVNCGTDDPNVQLKTIGAEGEVANAEPVDEQRVNVLATTSLAWGAITP
jgi:hypothetical protein